MQHTLIRAACNVQHATCNMQHATERAAAARRTARACAQLRLELHDPRGLHVVHAPQLGARPVGVPCTPLGMLTADTKTRRRDERGDRPLLGGARR